MNTELAAPFFVLLVPLIPFLPVSVETPFDVASSHWAARAGQDSPPIAFRRGFPVSTRISTVVVNRR